MSDNFGLFRDMVDILDTWFAQKFGGLNERLQALEQKESDDELGETLDSIILLRDRNHELEANAQEWQRKCLEQEAQIAELDERIAGWTKAVVGMKQDKKRLDWLEATPTNRMAQYFFNFPRARSDAGNGDLRETLDFEMKKQREKYATDAERGN
jgi:hypothetical protein